MQKDFEIKEREIALKHKEKMEEVLQNNIKIIDERMRKQQERVDELQIIRKIILQMLGKETEKRTHQKNLTLI